MFRKRVVASGDIRTRQPAQENLRTSPFFRIRRKGSLSPYSNSNSNTPTRIPFSFLSVRSPEVLYPRFSSRTTPRKQRRLHMDFLNTYFPTTPRRDGKFDEPNVERIQQQEAMSSEHEADDTGRRLEGRERVDENDDENNSPKSVINHQSADNEDERPHSTVEDNSRPSTPEWTVSSAILSSSAPIMNNTNDKPPHYERRNFHQQESHLISSTTSPLSKQYALLRRVRKHYSDTDADTTTFKKATAAELRDYEHDPCAVHFLAPMAEDTETLQTIKLTPRRLVHKSPVARVQSFDDSAFSPRFRDDVIETSRGKDRNKEFRESPMMKMSPIREWIRGATAGGKRQKDKVKEKEKEKQMEIENGIHDDDENFDEEKEKIKDRDKIEDTDKDNDIDKDMNKDNDIDKNMNKDKDKDKDDKDNDKDKDHMFHFFGIKFRRQ